jgi:phage FluMu protein Com
MITIECAWCDRNLALESLDATSVECPECLVTVELAQDPDPLAVAA